MVDEDETIEVASVGGRKPRLMARRILSEILQPRAEQIFHLPIRRGSPAGIGGLADHVSSPTFATPVGLALYAHRNRAPGPVDGSSWALTKVAGRLRGI